MGGRIDCYIDIASLFGYLGFLYIRRDTPIYEANGIEVVFHPVYLTDIIHMSNNPPPFTVKAKAKHGVYDIRRSCAHAGVPETRAPRPYAERSQTMLALRALHYIQQHYSPEVLTTVFHYLYTRFWTPPNADLTDPSELRTVLVSVPVGYGVPGRVSPSCQPIFTPQDVDTIVAGANDQKTLDLLNQASREAVDRGAFGNPWLWVRNDAGQEEPFFGSDRFHFVYEFLGLPYQDVALLGSSPAKAKETEPVVRVPFYSNQTITIGRDSKKSNLRFKNAAVSPVHCEIYSVLFDRDETFPPLIYVRDCQSITGTCVNGERIGKGPFLSPARLLADNDSISVGPCSLRIRNYKALEFQISLSPFQREEAKAFEDQFVIHDTIIGNGAYATVFLAVDAKTKQQLVCKVHDLERLGSTKTVDQEMSIWSQLDHPNIVAFRRAFRTDANMFTFSDLATGGDLFSLLHREQSLPELEIKWIITQMLKAVQYLHCKGVAHRDIKLENILCTTSRQVSHRIALADFGCSSATSLGRMTSNVGTNAYQAPEIQNEHGCSHGVAVDLWAVGILTLQLMAGDTAVEMPTRFRDVSDVEQLIWSVNITRANKRSSDSGTMSKLAQEFVHMCLDLNPANRPTAARAAKHEWLKGSASDMALFQERERHSAWKPRGVLIPAVVDLRKYEDCQKKEKQNAHLVAEGDHEERMFVETTKELLGRGDMIHRLKSTPF